MIEFTFCTSEAPVVISVDEEADFTCHVRVAATGKEVGRFEFVLVEEEYPNGDYLKLTWAFLDRAGGQYKRKGIGERILQLVKETSGLPIVAEEHDGLKRIDGSHLTQDAPGFVRRMREKGLIVSHRIEPDPESDDW